MVEGSPGYQLGLYFMHDSVKKTSLVSNYGQHKNEFERNHFKWRFFDSNMNKNHILRIYEIITENYFLTALDTKALAF